jgi:hypothetical protein
VRASEPAPRARFVIGTGRCGSTLLSRMLSENPEVLNVFELFSGIDQFFRFRRDPVAGALLAARLREDHPMLTMVMRRGYEVPEVVYPFGAPGARHAAREPIPWALGIAIPRVTDEPDRLFDELLEHVEALPTQTLAAHYREIFAWLTSRLGKRCWIERSGTSIDFLAELHDFFPDARFLHIHRDGREAALSMREYPVLRVAVAVMYGLLGEIEYSHEGLVALERAEPAAIDRLLETRPPIELYGRYWSDQIRRGDAARGRLDPDDFLEVRFEELVTHPREVMRRIAAFFEIGADEEWIARAAGLVRGLPERRFPALEPDERQRLDAACREAMALLGRGGEEGTLV